MKVDMVVMRHSASGAPHFLAQHIPAAIVNAGDVSKGCAKKWRPALEGVG